MEAINKYVHRKFDKKGKITTKLVETAEGEILKKMHEESLSARLIMQSHMQDMIYS
jgi:hypothetical protein